MKWLVDYKVENTLQLTEDEVISLVNEIIQRLSLHVQLAHQQIIKFSC